MPPKPFECVWDTLVAIVTEEARADDAARRAAAAEAAGDIAGSNALRRHARMRRVHAMESRGRLAALLARGGADVRN